jgi:hypothetical protein
MLGGHAAVTSFVGRTAEMARLSAWCQGPGRVSVMLVHGAGGQGKTRLTREFARNVGQEGRLCARETIPLTEVPVPLAASRDEFPAPGDEDGAGILLVVDEADLWPARNLRKLFCDMAEMRWSRVRLLLTARGKAEWWPGLRGRLDIPDVCWDELPLGPLDAASARELAVVAGQSHAAMLGWAQPSALTEDVWEQLAGGPPLSIELMVLAGMHAADAGSAAPEELHEAAELLLQKEQRCWEHMYGMDDAHPGSAAYRIRLEPRFMRRAAYTGTLTGPLGECAARQVTSLARLGCTLDEQQILDDHARCYPAGDNQYLAPLPACLSEEFLGLLVPTPARPPGAIAEDPWTAHAPFRILGLRDTQARRGMELTQANASRAGIKFARSTHGYSQYTFGPQLKPLIIRLARAASRWPHLAERQLYPLAEHYPLAVINVEGVWSELLKISLEPPDRVLDALSRAAVGTLPPGSPELLAAMNALQTLADRKAQRASPPAS